MVDGECVSQYKLKTNSKNAAKTYAKRISTQYWWDLGELDAIEITRKGAGGGKSSLYFNTNYHPVSSQGWMSLNLAGGRSNRGGGRSNGGKSNRKKYHYSLVIVQPLEGVNVLRVKSKMLQESV